MAWKRSKDGGLDYDVSIDIRYQAVKDKLFGAANNIRDDRPQASWVVVHPEIAKELEPVLNLTEEKKLSMKQKLKQRINSGGDLKHYYDN